MGWLIWDDNKDSNPLCNFFPEVLALVDVYASTISNATPHVRLRLNLGSGNTSEVVFLPLSDLEDVDWLSLDVRAQFYPEVSPVKVRRYLSYKIRSQLASAATEKQFRINSVGVHCIDNEVVFCTGGGLIRPSASKTDRLNIMADSISVNLDIDSNLSEGSAAADMLELISLAPNPGRIILAQNLLYIMRRAYLDAWKAPCTCVFLYSATGMQKTT